MISELVEQNFRASKAASLYFNDLVEKLDDFIHQFIQQQKRFEDFPEFCNAITFEKDGEAIDTRGSNSTLYRSPIASVRLYCNLPVGWISGEIEQRVPWTGRKCFAICPKPNSYTDLAPKFFGCYKFGERFPPAYLIAKQLILELAQGDITEEQVAIRSRFPAVDSVS